MKYSKLTYDLNGSTYQPKQLAVPTDSTYAIGVEFIKDGTRINGEVENYKLIDGENEISATTTLNDIGIFELTSTSDANDDKSYCVQYHSEKQPAYDVVLSGEQSGELLVSFNAYAALSDLVGIVTDFDANNLKIGTSVNSEEEAISSLKQILNYRYFAPPNTSRIYPTVYVGNSFTNSNLKYQWGMSESGKTGWVEYSQSKYGQMIQDSDFVDMTLQDMIDAGCTNMKFWGGYPEPKIFVAIRYGEYEVIDAKFDGLQINQVEDGNREI